MEWWNKRDKFDSKWALTGSVFGKRYNCWVFKLWLMHYQKLAAAYLVLCWFNLRFCVLCSALLLNILLFALTKCIDNICVSVVWVAYLNVYAVPEATVLYSPVAFLLLTADGTDDGDLFWVWLFFSSLRSISTFSKTSK